MKWGVPAYYGIQIIHLESKHVRDSPGPIFPTPNGFRVSIRKVDFLGKNSTSGNQETKSKPRWSRKHRRALASGRKIPCKRISSRFGKFMNENCYPPPETL